MRARVAALAALLLAGPLLAGPGLPGNLLPAHPAAAQAAPGEGGPDVCRVPCPWWDEAWHMRLPVLLHPRIANRVDGGFTNLAELRPDKVRNYPATVEVDFTAAIRDAAPVHPEDLGWPRDGQGRLASFTFDRDSVRVVEYDTLKGCILVPDRVTRAPRCAQGGDDLADAALPSTFSPGLWENPAGRDPNFEARRNAVGTLQWIVRGEFVDARLFFVYFDILENGAKPKPRYRPEDAGILDGLHFTRSGTDILGFAPGTRSSGGGVILAQALSDETSIALFQYASTVTQGVPPGEAQRGVIWPPGHAESKVHPSCRDLGLELLGTVCLNAPQGTEFYFRALASKPILVSLMPLNARNAAVWYPSVDGGLAGREFQFRAVASSSVGTIDAPVYVLSPAGQALVTASGPGSAFSGSGQGLVGSFSVNAGGLYTVSATRPVLVVSGVPSNEFGLNLVGPHGSPVSNRLVGFVRHDLTIVNAGQEQGEILLASPLTDPTSRDAITNAPIAPGPAKAIYSGGCSCSQLGEVWQVESRGDTPLWAKAGERGLVPIGGEHGQRFQVSLQPKHNPRTGAVDTTVLNDPAQTRLILVGLYNATRVLVTNATGAVQVNTTVGIHGWVDQTSSGKTLIPYGDWRIEASKPVAAYLYARAPEGLAEPTYATYYSAKMEPPVQQVGTAEFHGHAVGWTEKVRTEAVGPGERVNLRLTVVNVGRAVGGKPLPDDIEIRREVAVPRNATEPDVDLSSVLEAGVASFEARGVTLSVEVPPDASTGTVYQVNVTARSRGNPGFADVVRVVVTVQTRFEFTMRFLETNSTAIQKIVKPDSATCLDLEVRNTGTGDVTLRFQMSPTRKSPAAVGFDPRLLPEVRGACDPGGLEPLVDDEGLPAGTFVVKVREARTITLYVRAPADTRPLPLELEVQGTALEDASVGQQVSAAVFTNVEAKVKLTAANDTALVTPGTNATFRLRVENVGDVETPLEYGTTGLLPEGWAIHFVGAPPLLRVRGSVDAQGNRLDSAEFTVNLTAAGDAPVGIVVPVNVVASSSIIIDSGDTAKAFRQSDSAKVTATVANNFTLDQPEALPLTIRPGEPFNVTYDLRNAANGNFSLRVAQAALPRNWTMEILEPAAPVLLERGDRVAVRARVVPPLATPAGAYELGMALAASDAFGQAAQFRNLTVLVRTTAEFRLEASPGEVVLAPGGQREVAVRMVNSGNLPVVLRLTTSAPAGYQAAFPGPTRFPLAPGEEAGATLRVRAPDEPAEAAQAVRVLASDDGSGQVREAAVQARTGRVDLVATQVALANPTLRPGDAAVALVTVQNAGSIPVTNVGVALLVDGVGVRNETLRALPPGEPRTLALPWTVDAVPREVRVVVDPDDAYQESDESNNEATASLARDLPGAPAAALLLAALGAALAGGRRPPGPGGRFKPSSRGGGPDG